jgi:hypothetical protein
MRAAPFAIGLLAALSATSVTAAHAKPRPDLADVAQGVYQGSVISDARGSSRSAVAITVTKTGPNTVSVSSDYGRLPPFTTKLSRYMQTIQKTGAGGQVFLLDLSKTPHRLDVTDDQASWSGSLAGAE